MTMYVRWTSKQWIMDTKAFYTILDAGVARPCFMFRHVVIGSPVSGRVLVSMATPARDRLTTLSHIVPVVVSRRRSVGSASATATPYSAIPPNHAAMYLYMATEPHVCTELSIGLTT